MLNHLAGVVPWSLERRGHHEHTRAPHRPKGHAFWPSPHSCTSPLLHLASPRSFWAHTRPRLRVRLVPRPVRPFVGPGAHTHTHTLGGCKAMPSTLLAAPPSQAVGFTLPAPCATRHLPAVFLWVACLRSRPSAAPTCEQALILQVVVACLWPYKLGSCYSS